MLFLPILLGGVPLFWLIPRFGFRDDALALLFMTGAFLQIFVSVLMRYLRDIRPERRNLMVLIDQRQATAPALLEFLSSRLSVR